MGVFAETFERAHVAQNMSLLARSKLSGRRAGASLDPGRVAGAGCIFLSGAEV